MQRTNFGEMACSIARTLDVIGEPWSPMILRSQNRQGKSKMKVIPTVLGYFRVIFRNALTKPKI